MRGVTAVLILTGVWAAGSDYEAAIAQFRAEREAELKQDDGWLTVVGLHWLKSGDNRVGADQRSEVPLPEGSAPPRVGMISLHGGKAVFRPEPGVTVTLNGRRAGETPLAPNSDILAIRRLKFFLILREDRLAVRVKDNDSAARREFAGLNWYPVDPSWRIAAQFTPWDKPHSITFDTAAGVKEVMTSPGFATFKREGHEYHLEPVSEDKQLFFVMRDLTSGKTTYAASRFLYAEPAKDGVVLLDFNKAINPPCVFTAYATCPLPPPQNRLSVAVTAGERKYGNH